MVIIAKPRAEGKQESPFKIQPAPLSDPLEKGYRLYPVINHRSAPMVIGMTANFSGGEVFKKGSLMNQAAGDRGIINV